VGFLTSNATSEGNAMLQQNASEMDVQKDGKRSMWKEVGMMVLCFLGFLASLYLFLVGLQLLGDSFKCLGGRGAGSMFSAIENPIAGLMTGILSTVMVQSSSTSTSIVVGLVGADQISVHTGIPIIMGANIGTSVTNTIVSMGHVGVRVELQRAFSAATVHDMFNVLSVATLFPIEIIIGAIQGEGGPLYWLTKVITDAAMGGKEAGKFFKSPTKAITSPVAKMFLSNNKYIINALSLGKPEAQTPNTTNSSLCETRRLTAEPEDADEAAALVEAGATGTRALLSRRMDSNGLKDCSAYYCVSKSLDKNFKKISKSDYKKLTKCADYILSPESPCGGGQVCYLDAGKYWQKNIVENQIIKSGAFRGAGDVAGGIISLILSLILLTGGLFCLVKCLGWLMLKKAKRAIMWAMGMNDYIAIVVGLLITILVQSSSVTTSVLTPLAGMGIIILEKMLPLTLGANIGTTVTALLAALATFTHGAIHIALCHLFFNIFGILIFFPIPLLRRIPLGGARLLGLYASYYRGVPLIYILFTFVCVPGIFLGVSALFNASIAGGVVLVVVIIAAWAAFEFWWIWLGGCFKVLSEEAREQGEKELAAANAALHAGPAEGANEGEQGGARAASV